MLDEEPPYCFGHCLH